jgi:hypothetical protein
MKHAEQVKKVLLNSSTLTAACETVWDKWNKNQRYYRILTFKIARPLIERLFI